MPLASTPDEKGHIHSMRPGCHEGLTSPIVESLSDWREIRPVFSVRGHDRLERLGRLGVQVCQRR